jgi:hypothetical protein
MPAKFVRQRGIGALQQEQQVEGELSHDCHPHWCVALIG